MVDASGHANETGSSLCPDLGRGHCRYWAVPGHSGGRSAFEHLSRHPGVLSMPDGELVDRCLVDENRESTAHRLGYGQVKRLCLGDRQESSMIFHGGLLPGQRGGYAMMWINSIDGLPPDIPPLDFDFNLYSRMR